MSRPGFVLEVDDKTPPLMTMSGSDLRLDRFGVGTRVVYTPDAERSSDPVALIDAALSAPSGTAPLAARLTPSTKLTLLISDAQALPAPWFDPRRTLAERVLEAAARAGVDDVELVIANGVGQRWSGSRVTEVLGDRVATSFLPDGLVASHDVTADDLVEVGQVDGHPVRVNRRVAESDLVVVIGVRAAYADRCPLSSGITDAATVERLGTAGPAFADGVRDLLRGAADTFSLIAVLGQPLLGRPLRFVSKREWEWNAGDRLSYAGARQLAAALPRQGAQLLHGGPRADYAVIDVVGGEYAAAQAESRLVWQAANAVEVRGQADVLVTSVWGAAIDPSDPVGSPLSAAGHALVRQAGSHLGTPYTRDGGVLIALHPLRNRFSNRRQSAAADLFAKILPVTTDAAEIAERFAPSLQDEWYLDLYRKQFADHPLRVFQEWAAIAEATARYANVIWVGGDRRSAAVLGHRAASTYADALEIASDAVGTAPSITVLRGAGLALGDVR
ncbi:MAG: lactate racemase domain-containing protein [Arachnia sp.]